MENNIFENTTNYDNFDTTIKMLLNFASNKFISIVNELEATTDTLKRSEVAINYIKNESGIAAISFDTLIKYLSDIEKYPLSILRQLYLLERSIPRRESNAHNYQDQTWIDRLKIFADTYILETALVGKKILGKPKLYFTHASGDHTLLHIGKGTFGTDFCYWDQTTQKPVFVEFKHWGSPDILAAIDFYKDKIYNAKNVIIYTCDKKFYWVSYENENKTFQLIDNVTAPKLLYW